MNIYIQQIQEISENCKYTKWYVNIIVRAISRASDKKKANQILGYCEKHHIVPESFFKNRSRKGPKGFLEGIPEHKDNYAYLTAKEHIFCHLFLIKMIIRTDCKIKMSNAVQRMLNSVDGKYSISPNLYFILRKEYSDNHIFKDRELMKSFWRADNPFQLEKVKEKSKETKIEKYDDENYNNRDLAKQTWLQIYGVDNPSKSLEIKKKKSETCLNNFGVDHYAKLEKECKYCGEIKKDPHEKQCEKNPNRTNPTFKTFEVLSPNNQKFVINSGLRIFCEQNNISYGSLKLNKKTKGWILLG